MVGVTYDMDRVTDGDAEYGGPGADGDERDVARDEGDAGQCEQSPEADRQGDEQDRPAVAERKGDHAYDQQQRHRKRHIGVVLDLAGVVDGNPRCPEINGVDALVGELLQHPVEGGDQRIVPRGVAAGMYGFDQQQAGRHVRREDVVVVEGVGERWVEILEFTQHLPGDRQRVAGDESAQSDACGRQQALVVPLHDRPDPAVFEQGVDARVIRLVEEDRQVVVNEVGGAGNFLPADLGGDGADALPDRRLPESFGKGVAGPDQVVFRHVRIAGREQDDDPVFRFEVVEDHRHVLPVGCLGEYVGDVFVEAHPCGQQREQEDRGGRQAGQQPPPGCEKIV